MPKIYSPKDLAFKRKVYERVEVTAPVLNEAARETAKVFGPVEGEYWATKKKLRVWPRGQPKPLKVVVLFDTLTGVGMDRFPGDAVSHD